MTNLPHYKADDIAACKSIHSIRPDGVVRVDLRLNQSSGKFDKHPKSHWKNGTLSHPAHAHWPELPKSEIDLWFRNGSVLRGMGISCYKFGMVGVDVDAGDHDELMYIIKDKCEALPLGTARTQRGHRIYYSVHDSDLKNEIVGFKLDGWDGCGDILLYGQYDYLWHPVDTLKAIMKKQDGSNDITHIDMSIFKSTKPDRPPVDPNRIASRTDGINAEVIAETLGFTPHAFKPDTWYGACPICKDGETRYQVSQGDFRPLLYCYKCDKPASPADLEFIYDRVKQEHPKYRNLTASIEWLIPQSD